MLKEDGLDTPGLLSSALDGDAVALKTLEEGRNTVAAFLVMVIETIAPEAVVLSGGLCTDPRWYVDPVRKRIGVWTGIPRLADTPVRRAALWEDAVLHGAGILASSGSSC